MGRFLKENGKYDKTRAGKVMTGAGKALSFSAQQKLSLRLPLVRLYHEVETFQYRAIVDTLQTVEKMEKARTAYRGALMWMKDVSQQLDPDTCKQLEKFRKVQSNVRKTKARFDKLKLDTLQKVDLLSFSRCNLFSQALAGYQNTLIAICEKVSHTMTSVAETTKGYQHYEFSMLKELTETSKKLAEKTTEEEEISSLTEQSKSPYADRDVLLFFEAEYQDEESETGRDLQYNSNSDKERISSSPSKSMSCKRKAAKKKLLSEKDKDNDFPLLELDNDDDVKSPLNFSLQSDHIQSKDTSTGSSDFLTGAQNEDCDRSDLELLREILDSNCDYKLSNNLSSQIQDICQASSINQQINSSRQENLQNSSQASYFMPSQLLDMNKSFSSSTTDIQGPVIPSSEAAKSVERGPIEKNKAKQDMSSWYNLFADLDPLANPDLIGKKQVDEINC
ncbi:islet cell autoantigen 1-like isoform X2 [Stegodyphus dumicola]|nr:islet cell autoantigen 1-like isoform X2 [Stegodyphus dumicola]